MALIISRRSSYYPNFATAPVAKLLQYDFTVATSHAQLLNGRLRYEIGPAPIEVDHVKSPFDGNAHSKAKAE